jgi:CheY-like chemotaxis protein
MTLAEKGAMALLGFLKSWDEKEGEPVLKDHSTILAYLEDLIRIRSQVQFWISRDDLVPIVGKIDLLNEEAGTITIVLHRALPGNLGPNTLLDMVFALEGMRFDAPVKFVRRDGYLRGVFTVPQRVLHAERRMKMRARFGPRERGTCTILEDLFEGHGVTGRLINLSLEGLCMRIDRAISIQENRPIHVSPALFDAGRNVALVRIQNLPFTPLIECCGIVTHLEATPIGVSMGLHFKGLGGLETQQITHLLARRLPSFARGFPVRYRRGKENVESLPEPSSPEEEWSETTAEEAKEVDIEQSQEDEIVSARVSTHERLLQIKKRGKKILLIIHDELDLAILSGTLQVDGYRQIHEAKSVLELLRTVRTIAPDLIILEQNFGNVGGQQLLERLRKYEGCKSAPVIMIADAVDVRTALMAKAARIDHLQTWPIDYDGVLKDVLARLLILE